MRDRKTQSDMLSHFLWLIEDINPWIHFVIDWRHEFLDVTLRRRPRQDKESEVHI